MIAGRPATVLAALALALMLAASLAGILRDDTGDPYAYTTLRQADVEIYGGQGPYRFDTTHKAVLFRGFDWANLFVAMPLLLWSTWQHRQGRVRGQLLLMAVFAYLAYNYLIGVMGNAFNELFLVWTALFSTGLFGLVLVLRELDLSVLPYRLAKGFPRKSLAVYMIVLGLFLFVQYTAEILTAYCSGGPPLSLGVYTTLELAALELGIMVPLHIWGGLALWQQKAGGYILAIILTFTALMTFISLSMAVLLLYFMYHSGSGLDVSVPVVLALITLWFSLAITRQLKKFD